MVRLVDSLVDGRPPWLVSDRLLRLLCTDGPPSGGLTGGPPGGPVRLHHPVLVPGPLGWSAWMVRPGPPGPLGWSAWLVRPVRVAGPPGWSALVRLVRLDGPPGWSALVRLDGPPARSAWLVRLGSPGVVSGRLVFTGAP